jgi:hypothetical protein
MLEGLEVAVIVTGPCLLKVEGDNNSLNPYKAVAEL